MKRIALLFLLVLLISCQSSLVKHEKGVVWCNERYLHKLPAPFWKNHENSIPAIVSVEGYIYAMAAGLALQGTSSEDKSHYFAVPQRLTVIDSPPKSSSGFEVITFNLDNSILNKPDEIIIAFTGSNDWKDWVFTNILFSKKQFKEAVAYVKKIHSQTSAQNSGKSIVLTGYSLGGALALHAAKNPATKDLVDLVWIFNPSPKSYTDKFEKNDSLDDDRIWMASNQGEFLEFMRKRVFRMLPGFSKIDVPSNQVFSDYYLVKSNFIYAHFRWVLTRMMLHVADLKLYQERGGTIENSDTIETDPLNILKNSEFEACRQ